MTRWLVRLLIILAAAVAGQFISFPFWLLNCLVPGLVFSAVVVVGVCLFNLLMQLDYPGRVRRR
ncbi:MAG: hypothetical protein HC853_17780 [Anaerolineae bacterium]|nr:hypothetical protein [Anaerolineae bacterium]